MQDELEKSLNELDITKDESDRLSNCFKNPEFQKLFSEYLEEISDPTVLERYEKEIKECEKQYGVETKLVKSKPEFVLKTKNWESGQTPIKIFVNICSSETVEKPKIETLQLGTDVSLPHCHSPMRKIVDKGETVKVVDVSFHPEVFQLSQSNKELLDFVKTSAMETIIGQYGLLPGMTKKFSEAFAEMDQNTKIDNIRKSFHTLKGIKCKGTIQPCVLRSKIDNASVDKVLDEKLMPPFLKKNAEKEVKADQQAPKYKIVYGSKFELSNYANSDLAKADGKPEYIKLEIDLPQFDSVRQFDLDLFKDHLQFKSFKPREYQLDIRLKYSINEIRSVAKFDKSTHKLTVQMPILTEKELTAKSEELMSPSRFNVTSPSSTQPSKTEETVDKVSKGLNNLKLEDENTIPLKDISIEKINQINLELSKDIELLPIKLYQDNTTFSILLCVKQVIPTSIVINWAKRKISKVDFNELFSAINQSNKDISFPSHFMSIKVECQNSSQNDDSKKHSYGIVLEFPALRKDLDTDFDSADEEGENSPFFLMGEPVELLRASWTSRNVVLLFKKPLLKDEPFFWSSVASGRTLDSGLLITPFQGVNSAFSTLDLERDSIFKKILNCNPNAQVVEKKSRKLSDSSRLATKDCQQNSIRGILKRRTVSECEDAICDIDLDLVKTPGVAQITPLEEKCEVKDIFLFSNGSISEEGPKNSPDNSLDSNRLSLNSSLANSPIEESNRIYFPDGEKTIRSRRRFYSYTFDESDMLDLPLNSPSESTEDINARNQSRSVLFCKHDVKMDFCPEESVSILHHSIQNRKKKAKSRDRKRLNSTSEADELRQKAKKSSKKRDKFTISQEQEILINKEIQETNIQDLI